MEKRMIDSQWGGWREDEEEEEEEDKESWVGWRWGGYVPLFSSLTGLLHMQLTEGNH